MYVFTYYPSLKRAKLRTWTWDLLQIFTEESEDSQEATMLLTTFHHRRLGVRI